MCGMRSRFFTCLHLFLFASESDIQKIDTYRRIVVYGAGMGGVCAAYKAAQYAWSLEGFDNFEIMLINPVPVPKLGGIGTVGGQNLWDTDKNIEKNNIEDKAVGKNNIEDTGNVAAKNTAGEDKVFEKINIPKNLIKNLKMLIFIIPSIVIAGFSLRGIYVANNDLAHYRKIEKNISADTSGGNDDTKQKSEDKADTDKTDTKLSDTDTKTKVTAVADTKKKSIEGFKKNPYGISL